ncbi:uncharacterized protein TRAVEDRAFT_49131 [Trametes versicolor FP-101664 SS1]|uniref:uncharacterized protein n=1 Tax=Trametes versicolor (strain FP-101664) TaxID=717944 RepID=UPI0004622CC7|nr:uncharacterized protein TRAVEDRAFT_49131 [Trametes versicolor FP-101664 SS1]EIW56295.1 hypothetical protein TRAVEDRAFT_49131 [Trametes versicolor FP-101664 SS1]
MAECIRCSRTFSDANDLLFHALVSDNHHRCRDCDEDYTTKAELRQHFVDSPKHFYCFRCNLHLATQIALVKHNGWTHRRRPRVVAHSGSTSPTSTLSVSSTISTLSVSSSPEAKEQEKTKFTDRYCVPCKRAFMSPGNLRSHQRSHIHQGRRIPCPFSGCGKRFVSTAAVFIHLESGTCASGMTLDKLVRLVARVDHEHILTIPDRLANVTTNANIHTNTNKPFPSSSTTGVSMRGRVRYVRDGALYRCSACGKAFRTYLAFTRHAGSAAHAAQVFRCPLAHGCGAEFRTFSGLCQHVESERCRVRGLRDMVDKVIRSVLNKVKGMTAR